MSRDTRAWICAVGPTSLKKKAVVTLRAWLFMFVCRVFLRFYKVSRRFPEATWSLPLGPPPGGPRNQPIAHMYM